MSSQLDGTFDRISYSCAHCTVAGVIETVVVNGVHLGLTGRCPACGRHGSVWFRLERLGAFCRNEAGLIPEAEDAADVFQFVSRRPLSQI